MNEVEGKLFATNRELGECKALAKKMKEVEGKLLATNKELDKYKTLAKNNDKRFKDYQNDHFPKCQCSTRIKELEVTLRKKDYELNECKKTVNKIEEMVKQNQIGINDFQSKWPRQAVLTESLGSTVRVIQEELKLYDWRIKWDELDDNDGRLESAPFHAASDLYCLSLSVYHNKIFGDDINVYLHRCRDNDKEDEKEGRIQTLGGFSYKIYVICDDIVILRNSGFFTDYSLFNIGRAYQRSKGFLCFKLDYEGLGFLEGCDIHIFCTACAF